MINPPSLATDDLHVVEGAALAHCMRCDQLTLHTVDQVLEVYSEGALSEVVQRCLSCEDSRIMLVTRP